MIARCSILNTNLGLGIWVDGIVLKWLSTLNKIGLLGNRCQMLVKIADWHTCRSCRDWMFRRKQRLLSRGREILCQITTEKKVIKVYLVISRGKFDTATSDIRANPIKTNWIIGSSRILLNSFVWTWLKVILGNC